MVACLSYKTDDSIVASSATLGIIPQIQREGSQTELMKWSFGEKLKVEFSFIPKCDHIDMVK